LRTHGRWSAQADAISALLARWANTASETVNSKLKPRTFQFILRSPTSLPTTPPTRSHLGGPLCCDPVHLAPGPRDQKEVEARPDVQIYSTPPLMKTLKLRPVTLDLYANHRRSIRTSPQASRCIPRWTSHQLTEGILRASYRESTTGAPKPSSPARSMSSKSICVHQQCLPQRHRIRLR